MSALVRYSSAAESDLDAIAAYTTATWSEAQTGVYLDSIEACCERLVLDPGMGRSCEMYRGGLLRFNHRSHVIFYAVEDGGIFVSRILHSRMLPESSDFDL